MTPFQIVSHLTKPRNLILPSYLYLHNLKSRTRSHLTCCHCHIFICFCRCYCCCFCCCISFVGNWYFEYKSKTVNAWQKMNMKFRDQNRMQSFSCCECVFFDGRIFEKEDTLYYVHLTDWDLKKFDCIQWNWEFQLFVIETITNLTMDFGFENSSFTILVTLAEFICFGFFIHCDVPT